ARLDVGDVLGVVRAVGVAVALVVEGERGRGAGRVGRLAEGRRTGPRAGDVGAEAEVLVVPARVGVLDDLDLATVGDMHTDRGDEVLQLGHKRRARGTALQVDRAQARALAGREQARQAQVDRGLAEGRPGGIACQHGRIAGRVV